MIQPLPALLQMVDRHLPRDLVSRRARAVLRRRAAQVPSAWFSGCVECRLTEGAEQNDLLVYATRGAGGQRALGELLAGGGGGEFGAARPFLAAWTRRRSLFHRELAAIWLEYDLPVTGETPDPFVFVCLYPDYLDPVYPRHRFGSPLPATRIRSIAAAGLRAALGAPVERRRLELVARCAMRLPMHGRMLHVVARPGSNSDLRIGAILPSPGVRKWLDAIGWTGNRRQLELLEYLLGGGTDLLHVQVELGEAIRSKLAIDFEGRVPPPQSSRWDRFVDRLASTKTVVRDKARAAVDWMCSRPVQLPGELAPARMDYQLFFKLTTTPDALEAKAYLCFQPRYAFV